MPDAVVALLPYAEEWGISDDYERELKVADAGDYQLLDLICSMEATDRDSLLAWLEGPESYHPNPTEDYVALKCLLMAVESAKAKLRARGILV
jgi:hypothetical protein